MTSRRNSGRRLLPRTPPRAGSAIVTPSGKMWIYGGGIMDVETRQDKHLGFSDMDVGQNPVPPVNLKVDGHPLYHMISRF